MQISRILTRIFIIPLCFGFLFAACDDKDSGEVDRPTITPTSLSVSQSSFNFTTGAAQTETFTVESKETAWEFVDYPDWITLSPKTGSASSSVVMNVSANPSGDSRTTTFYLKAVNSKWKEEKTITVTQAGSEPYITLNSDYLSFGGKAQSQTVEVSSNFDWTVSTQQSWITLQKSSDQKSLTVSVSDNLQEDYRTGIIIFNKGNQTLATLTVEQFPADVSSSDMTLNFRSSASKYDITISSENEWTATVSASWIQISPTAGGVGDTRVSVEVTPNDADNDRRGYISIFTGTSERLQIQVIQKGMHMETVNYYDFPSAGGTHIFDYTADRPWTARIEGDASWLTLSPSSGSGEGEILIKASPNTTLQPRNATVIISPENYPEISINLTQTGKYLRTSVNSLSFFARGGVSEAITVETDSEFTLTTNVSWLTINALSQTVFTVTAQANPSSDLRKGVITLAMQGLSEGSYAVEIPVTQTGEGGSFVIEGYPEDADWNNGSSGSITITVNGYSSDQNWN